MRSFLAFLLLLVSFSATADTPEGYVVQKLKETDGHVLMPKDWFFTSQGTTSGWVWTFSKEDPSLAPYKTGMRIQLLFGVAEGTGKPTEEFVLSFLAAKRDSTSVVRECEKRDMGAFYRQCLEVVEQIAIRGVTDSFRVLYSAHWGKESDMVVVSTFGAPSEQWSEVASIVDVMSEFTLVGPNFGKSE